MEYYIYTSNDELYHHGVKGMKWGVRLYQKKDGSLTALGKKRRASLEDKISKLEAKNKKLGGKKDDGDDATPAKKSVKDMTDDEIRNATNRLNLEKNYADAVRNTTPEVKAKRGKKFVDTFLDKSTESFAEKIAGAGADLVAQSMKSVGAKYLNQWLKNTFGDEVEKVYTNNKK